MTRSEARKARRAAKKALKEEKNQEEYPQGDREKEEGSES